MKTDKKLGRPRLHPEGLTERLCVPVSQDEYRKLKEQSVRRDVPIAKIVRERLNQ